MSLFRNGWLQGRAFEQVERERLHFLRSAPLPKNPPELTRPVKARVLRAFCIGGVRQEPGTEVTLDRHTALSLAAIGKAKLLDD